MQTPTGAVSSSGDSGETTAVTTSEVVALDLSGIRELSQEELETFLPHFTKLTELNLAHCPLAELPSAAAVPQLVSLTLDNVPVDTAGIIRLAEYPRLTSLSLRGVSIDRFAALELAALSTLQRLDLRGTGLTETDVQFLRETIPQCEIHLGE